MRESESEERNVHIDVGDTSSMGARDITRNIRVVATRTTRSSRTSQRLALLPLSWSCTSKRHRTLLRHDQSTSSSVVSWVFARARSFRCCVRRTSASGRLDDAKVVAVLRQAVEGALCVVPTPSDRQPANQPTNQATNQDRSRGSVPATHRLGSTTDRIRWSPTTAPRAPRATRREPHLSDEP